MDAIDLLDPVLESPSSFVPMGRTVLPLALDVRATPDLRIQAALAHVLDEIRRAVTAGDNSCRVLFRELDGWRIQDMKALARPLRASPFGYRVEAQANVFEPQPDRKYAWVHVVW